MMRRELTALERDQHVAKWIELADKRASFQPETRPGRPESGVRRASRGLGIQSTDAHRAVKVASLTPEAKEAARTLANPLDISPINAFAWFGPMMMTVDADIARLKAAERQRRCRERQRAGVLMRVTLDLTAGDLDALIDAGILEIEQSEDAAAVARAILNHRIRKNVTA